MTRWPRTFRGWVITAGVAALGFAGASAATAQAEINSPHATTLSELSVNADSASLVGPQITAVHVSVHIADLRGVAPVNATLRDQTRTCPCLFLTHRTSGSMPAAGAPWSRVVPLRLVSGTPTDG